jgi:site-specific DNA-methyltransferase (adenine-specific)
VVTIRHLSVRDVADAGVFDGVSSYDTLIEAIKAYGLAAGEVGSDGYNDRVGAAFEVYNEFFLARYGTDANPHFGIISAQHTSQNKFQVGYDFTATDLNGDQVFIQSKFRGNPMHKFTRSELGTFVSISDEEGIPASRRVLFTNIEHRPGDDSNGAFDCSYAGGLKQMRVVGRLEQESFIERDPNFWTDLISTVAQSAQAPIVAKAPVMWNHQTQMHSECGRVMRLEIPRGRVICATGGGKTRVEYQVLHDGFFQHNLTLQVIVAPRIGLLVQHHENFKGWGLFHRDGVVAIHFRTGDSAETDKFADCEQTIKKEELVEALKKYEGRNILIFVTYASEEKLFGILKDTERPAGLAIWDEFHHTVKQDAAYKDHLLSLPVARNLFFSASEKCGRVMSSLDEKLYGPKLADVSYSDLRKSGILVPKLRVKLIRLNPNCGKLSALDRDMRKAAERENFDLKDAVTEAASILVARQDLLADIGHSNIVTFSKAVPICKTIVWSEATRGELASETLLETVHSDIAGRLRKASYERIKLSKDSILCQHSILVEGIDLIAFNAAVFSREMEVISTQQAIGRIVRADPEDTQKLRAGEISLDSPEEWKKYCATLYVIIHDKEMDNFKKFVLDLVSKLQGAGLCLDDYQFVDLVEERHGKKFDENGWIVDIGSKACLEGQSLNDYINHLVVEDEETTRAGGAWGSGDSVSPGAHAKLRQQWEEPGQRAKLNEIIQEAKVAYDGDDWLIQAGYAIEHQLPLYMDTSEKVERCTQDLLDPSGDPEEEALFSKLVGISRQEFVGLVEGGLFDRETLDGKISIFAERSELVGKSLRERFDILVQKWGSIGSFSSEVMTPTAVIERMTNLLPVDVLSSTTKTFLDPACGKGTFLCYLFVWMMETLADKIPDEKDRAQSIISRIGGYDISKWQIRVARSMLGELVRPYEVKRSELLLECRDFLRSPTDMKFDVVIGNPPYHEKDQAEGSEQKNAASASPLYQKFHFKAIKELGAEHILFVIPARCMAGGKGLKDFRDDLKAGKVQAIIFNEDSTEEWFGGAGPREGHIIYHWNRSHLGKIEYTNDNTGFTHPVDGSKYDILLRDPRAEPIVDKVLAHGKFIYNFRINPFGMNTDHFKKADRKEPQEGSNVLQCAYYNAGKQRRLSFRHVKPTEVTKNQNFVGKFKAITATVFGASDGQDIRGTWNIFILKPNEVCTATYLMLGAFDTQEEANNFKDFMHSALAQYMVSLRKPTHHIVGALGWLPELDWSRPWSSKDLYEFFKLTEDEIHLVETEMAHAMKRHAKYLSKE